MFTVHALYAPLAATSSRAVGAAAVGILLACTAAAVTFIVALVSIARARTTAATKCAWILLTFALPIFGSLLWFFIGRREYLRRPHVA
ncbi:PLD nuclease N-terminal domain-containing protein [Streptomyces venezuelae]|uniref:PLD nuclease N-terminal domain-containing protein n=1 Tax=Streptomyces venezuelae TaxID=54571 RepID=UPI0034251B48